MRWFLILGLMAACTGSEPEGETDTDEDTDIIPVDADGDGHTEDVDCDDDDPVVHPGADELCDGKDNDCDSAIDEDPVDGDLYYADADRDGYGDDDAPPTPACEPPVDLAAVAGDCNDDDPAIHPAATEVCDPADVDEDCDGLADDADDSVDSSTFTRFHADADGDGFGDPDTILGACDPAEGRVLDDTDCNDEDPAMNPDLVCPSPWNGDWDARLTIVFTRIESGETQTCDASGTLVVDSEATEQVHAPDGFSCLLGSSTYTFPATGSFLDDDTIEFEYELDPVVMRFEADFSQDPDRLDGEHADDVIVESNEFHLDGTLEASRAD